MIRSIRMDDLTIHESLAVVVLDGFQGEPEYENQIDAPGSANWFCGHHGMAVEDRSGPGILWTDYDFTPEPWKFSVLVDGAEVEAVVKLAGETGYTHITTGTITEPDDYGDGAGTVEILKHADGWVLIPN